MPSSASESLITKSRVVRAGAGAGKTYTLVQQTLSVAREFKALNGRYPKVVVTTFTRKATQELRERLLARALTEEKDLVEFVQSRSTLQVSTIHGVLDLYLKRQGTRLGIDPDYQILSEGEAERAAAKILRQQLLENNELTPFLFKLNFSQLLKLLRDLHSLAYHEGRVEPYSLPAIEALAEGEIAEIGKALGQLANRIEEQTENSKWLDMAASFRNFAEILASPQTWLDRRQAIERRLSGFKKASLTSKEPAVDSELDEECKEWIGKLKELLEETFSPEVWLEHSRVWQELNPVAQIFSKRFRQWKLQTANLEISDLEGFAWQSMQLNPETASAFASEWDYWLIDEFQDTSPLQARLLKVLTGGRPVFVVGDPQQSIYLFRGARSEVFSSKEIEIQAAGGSLERLPKNYRSRPPLLAFLNDFLSSLKQGFAPMQAALAENSLSGAPPEVSLIWAEANSAENVDCEWKALVCKIQSLIEYGAELEEIAILTRTNRDLANAGDWLTRFRIPYQIHSASGFFQRREVLDALSLLKFLLQPHDEKNLLALMRSPWYRIPDQVLADAAQRWRSQKIQLSLWQYLSQDCQAEAILQLQAALKQVEELGFSAVFQHQLEENGLLDSTRIMDSSGRKESNLWKLICSLAREEKAPGFNPLTFIAGKSVESKFSFSDQNGEENDAIAAFEPNKVNLMTVHAAKGLQFKHILLPKTGSRPKRSTAGDLTHSERDNAWSYRWPIGEENKKVALPTDRAWLKEMHAREMEEHERLLYVALTRAQESLCISWTEPVLKHSWAEMLKASKFWQNENGVTDFGKYKIEQKLATEMIPMDPEKMLTTEGHIRPVYKISMSPRRSSISVSELVAKKSRVMDAKTVQKRLEAAREGMAIHQMMELLKLKRFSELKPLAEKWFPGREEDILNKINRTLSLQRPPLVELIENGQAEWPFSCLLEKQVVEGQIDLWARDAEGSLWIVDYKSGRKLDLDAGFAQLNFYAQALRKAGILRGEERAWLAVLKIFDGSAEVRAETWVSEIKCGVLNS